MNRRRPLSANLSFVCLAFALALLGCQKSADQQSSSSPSSSPDASAPAASNAPASAPGKEPAPPPRPLVVPADTVISVVLERGIRALLLIGAAAVLSWGWGIDFLHLDEDETQSARLIHGVLSALIIFLISRTWWS